MSARLLSRAYARGARDGFFSSSRDDRSTVPTSNVYHSYVVCIAHAYVVLLQKELLRRIITSSLSEPGARRDAREDAELLARRREGSFRDVVVLGVPHLREQRAVHLRGGENG